MHHPDLVVLDVVLPDMTGIDTCRLIKNDKDLENICTLASGIQISSEHQAEGLDIGADGYIARPISNKELPVFVPVSVSSAKMPLRKRRRSRKTCIATKRGSPPRLRPQKGCIYHMCILQENTG